MTAQWYEQNLGFTASLFPKTPPHAYASLQRDGVELMLLRQEGFRKPEITRPDDVWDAYIRTEGLTDFYHEVRTNIPLKSELTQRPYGDTEFEVTDPNGYTLVFGEIV
jgi:hypothetical protein